ncbi:MAG: DUF4838 domain-containing protein [Ruminococcaceae bacterium]|nr:DUF4838 domain-containing protein [Oscillospiraceae bacterium]
MSYKIYKLSDHAVVDFAATELKKYLRMMMPECGDIAISRTTVRENDGFTLGLMQDFGLDVSEAADTELDDILHIQTTARGGVIAGSNPRSVLLAAYRFLQENGCRWLFPGIDGEYIPVKDVQAVSYHKMADCRYRGQCNEGAESQQCMIETIDFTPKIGMNVYMIEFDNPRTYYDSYYNHSGNKTRRPEPVTPETVKQWKRVCECEIERRGLQFHDMGHGWTSESFGIRSDDGWKANMENPVPAESVQYLAEIGGVRGLYKGVALNTNFCMSNPEARAKVVKYVADYAQKSAHVTYLHVWLADWQRNHCECAACAPKTPSDWYVVLLNEIDAELSVRKLDTRIVFCAYSDTAFEPTCEHIKNPARFSMLLGAISRSYTYSVEKDPRVELTPFVRNVTGRLSRMEEYVMRAQNWRDFAPCASFAYEYHFWKHQFFAPGVLSFAKRIYEDILSYKANGFDGVIEDGSQRSFFPNGLCYWVYGQTLFDNSASFDALVEDYFTHAYGEDWREFYAVFEQIDTRLSQKYLEVPHSLKYDKTHYHNAAMVGPLQEVAQVCDRLDALLLAHENMPMRAQTVSMRLLEKYSEFCRGLAAVFALKAAGKDLEASDKFSDFSTHFAAYEVEIERYFDQHIFYTTYRPLLKETKALEQ